MKWRVDEEAEVAPILGEGVFRLGPKFGELMVGDRCESVNLGDKAKKAEHRTQQGRTQKEIIRTGMRRRARRVYGRVGSGDKR